MVANSDTPLPGEDPTGERDKPEELAVQLYQELRQMAHHLLAHEAPWARWARAGRASTGVEQVVDKRFDVKFVDQIVAVDIGVAG